MFPQGGPAAARPAAPAAAAPAAAPAVLCSDYSFLLTYRYYKLKEAIREITIYSNSGCAPGLLPRLFCVVITVFGSPTDTIN